MKILLLNPPFLDKYSKSSRSPAVTKSGTIYFPLWLSYAAGVLDKKGYELQLIDAPAKCYGESLTLKLIKDYNPEMIVIDTSTASINSDLAFTKKIKEALPEIKTVMVGTHVSACYSEILPKEAYVDFICKHEYDYTLPDIAEKLYHPEKYEEILGICYVENGVLKVNPDRPFIEDLDELPFVSEVYKKYLDIHDYFYAHVNYPTVSIFSSRGCPSKCFYCMYSQVMFGKQYRKRSPQSLYDECVYITKNFPDVNEILIDDDNFAVDQKNVREFCKLMINGKVKLKWVIEARVNLTYDTMVLMRKAGCKLVVVGFESGNQQVLDNMHKGITLEQSLKFDKAARRAKMRVHGCFMVGNPGETKQTMMETLDFSEKLHLDTVQYFPLMVYPGTEAYEWAKQNNFIRAQNYSEWLKSDGMHNCVLNTPELSSKDLVRFCNFARRQFYLRPSYIAMKAKQCLTNKDDLVRTTKAFGTFSHYLFKRN